MKCLYCNTQCEQENLLTSFFNKFYCNQCFNKVNYYTDMESNKLCYTIIYYDNYTIEIELNYTNNTTHLYSLNTVNTLFKEYKKVLTVNSILELTPQNIQSKLKTIVNFS